jgi:ethanolamine utilization protein EutN
MIIGKIVGNVWATRKDPSLYGITFLIVELEAGEKIVVSDSIGAGIGDRVIITRGTGAQNGLTTKSLPIDAITIGIIDEKEEN